MLIKMVAGDVRPIGIFDSGAGGLSILREVQKIAPYENLIYFAEISRAFLRNSAEVERKF